MLALKVIDPRKPEDIFEYLSKLHGPANTDEKEVFLCDRCSEWMDIDERIETDDDKQYCIECSEGIHRCCGCHIRAHEDNMYEHHRWADAWACEKCNGKSDRELIEINEPEWERE